MCRRPASVPVWGTRHERGQARRQPGRDLDRRAGRCVNIVPGGSGAPSVTAILEVCRCPSCSPECARTRCSVASSGSARWRPSSPCSWSSPRRRRPRRPRPGRSSTAGSRRQDVRLSMPPTDQPKGIAIYFHGQNGGVDNRMDEPWLQSLVRDGWIVASSDFHTDSWGNEASTDDTTNLLDWAEEQTDRHADPALRLRLDGRHRLAQRDDPRRPRAGVLVRRQAGRRPHQDGQRPRRRRGSSARPSAGTSPATATRSTPSPSCRPRPATGW